MKSSSHAEKRMRSSVNAVVIGGGIAGVCCAQELVRICNDNVVLISASDTLVESASIFSVTNHLDEVAVYERKTDQFVFSNPNITLRRGNVISIDFLNKEVHLDDGSTVSYSKLCICTGVRPKLIANHELILGLRDLNSLEVLSKKLANARRVAIVGNGGISLELIHELRNINVDWIIKDKYIGSVFFDASASAFILPSLMDRAITVPSSSSKSHKDESQQTAADTTAYGGYGLGPEWVTKFGLMKPKNGAGSEDSSGSLTMHYEQQVQAISSDCGVTWQCVLEGTDAQSAKTSTSNSGSSCCGGDFPLWIRTTNGEVFGVDFIISATGVQPNTDFISTTAPVNGLSPVLAADGCIVVNESMETSVSGVFAAGDCCSFQGKNASNLYFQMKLWTQARSMGVYTAQCMCQCADQYGLDAQFDLFTHITRFFGFKVVMLGRYNGQGLDGQTERLTKQMVVTSEGLVRNEWFSGVEVSGTDATATTGGSAGDGGGAAEVEIWLRVTPAVEYIKLVVLRGKVIGALLIGNTELEEVFENLILNRLDVNGLGVGLLDPDIDIADYFD